MRMATTALLVSVGGLLSLGLVMLFSAGMTVDGGAFPLNAVGYVGLGILGAWVAAWVDYRELQRYAWLLWGVAVAVLVLVLAVGSQVGGGQRWLDLGIVSVQPSEFAKLALVIALAHYLDRHHREVRTVRGGLMVPGVFIGLVLLLIFKQHDWGATLLLAAVTGIMLLVGGVRWLHLVPVGVVGVAGLVAMLLQDPVRLRRVLSWLDLEATKAGTGYQTWQSIVAFGSGGWTGMGLGNGLQKYSYIPLHQSDFIFPVVGQELGLICTLGVVLAFAVVVICGCSIAWRARDTFGFLLCTGLTFLIGLQAFINIGVVTNVLPHKGLPLPFISRGGSNLVVMLLCVGLLISVARRAARGDQRRPGNRELEEMPSTMGTS
jgi:cell division protein FtsW